LAEIQAGCRRLHVRFDDSWRITIEAEDIRRDEPWRKMAAGERYRFSPHEICDIFSDRPPNVYSTG
jgi:hypothetical protein